MTTPDRPADVTALRDALVRNRLNDTGSMFNGRLDALIAAVRADATRAADAQSPMCPATCKTCAALAADERVDTLDRDRLRLADLLADSERAARAAESEVAGYVNTGSAHDRAMAWSEGHTAGYEEALGHQREQMVAVPVDMGRYTASRYDTDTLHRLHIWNGERSWDIDVPRAALAAAEAPGRVSGLEAALAHAEKNLEVIALTLTDHPEYPLKAVDVDAARSLARFTAQDIRAALAAQPAAPDEVAGVSMFPVSDDPQTRAQVLGIMASVKAAEEAALAAQSAAPEAEPERCAFEALPGHGRCDLTRDDAEHHGCNNPRCLHDGRRRGYNCHPFRSAARPLTPAPR